MTWYLRTLASIGVPTSLLCLSMAERLLARDDVVLEDVGVDRGADLLVVLVDGRVRRREERVLAALEVDARALERADELVEVVVALDVGLLLAIQRALVAPHDLRALKGLEGGDHARVAGRAHLGRVRRHEGRRREEREREDDEAVHLDLGV